MAKRIGITLGDVTGIGPEVTLKALASELESDDTQYELIGDAKGLQVLNERLGLKLPLGTSGAGDRILLSPGTTEPLPSELPPGAPAAARAAIDWLREAAQRALRRELAAVVTAPVNKESIVRSGIAFVGQTEFLAALAGTQRFAMMLLGQAEDGRWLRVVLATTHVPLKLVSERLTRQQIELAIELAAQACRDLSLESARIGVCGLNPHAGEGGHLGTEEQTVIGPAVSAMQKRRFSVTGPLSADALFHQAYHGGFDIVIAMYHDQGLAPLKMIAFEQGVNWTLGLPFIRTSPDHGTAYDIAGQNKANGSSMRAAIRLAKKLAQNNP